MIERTEEHIQNIPLELLHPFFNHPFQVLDDDKMKETVASIKELGVLVPIIIRPKETGGYEVISGHRRCRASQIAGRSMIPAIVREVDDDTAVMLMVDANLQREKLLPSEKAFAYQMKLEAMKRKGRLSQVETVERTDQKLAKEVGESRNQIHRYIRLTALQPELLRMVDDGHLALTSAVELSHLPTEVQVMMVDVMEREECIPSLSQSVRLRTLFREGELNQEMIEQIIAEENPIERKIVLKAQILDQFFPKDMKPLDTCKLIEKILKDWQRRERRKQR